jgi:cytidyltransferase-like protein
MIDVKILRYKHTIRSIEDILSLKPKPRNIAFYGGSFNPFHIGHLSAVEAALAEYVDYVVICPHSHSPDKPALDKTIEFRTDLIALAIPMTHEPDRILIAAPTFIDGIQNMAFVDLAGMFAEHNITSFVLMGADAIGNKYPEFMRAFPHLISPRTGYSIAIDGILTGPYYVLQKTQEHFFKFAKQNLKDYFTSDTITPTAFVEQYSQESDYLIAAGEVCEELKRFDEAEACFLQVLTSWQGSNSVYELSNKIKDGIARGVTMEIPYVVRYAMFRLFKLSINYQDRHLAEEYLLDAAYKAEDPGILMGAGVYFLNKSEAEVDTALGYFESACKLDPVRIDECDKQFKKFLARKGTIYPYSSLAPLINYWDAVVRDVKGKLTSS